ncbi:MAG: hypothetical protein ACK5LZ_04810 [Anaerorhabdus sp.]
MIEDRLEDYDIEEEKGCSMMFCDSCCKSEKCTLLKKERGDKNEK